MPISKKSLYSVIVSYNPQINQLLKLINTLVTQGVSSVVVDNGTLSEEDFNTLSANCHIIRLQDNFGIAKAQNMGIEFSRHRGAKYILFFDQDSEITLDYVDNLLVDYSLACDKSNFDVATIGPVFTDARYGFFYKVIKLNSIGWRIKINPQFRDKPFEVTLIISSGSLVPVHILNDVGDMDENLFIDYVDTEWCLRAVNKGYKIYISTSAKMVHAIGDDMLSFWGINVPVHSPSRRYYRIRNGFLLFRMKHIPVLLKLRDSFYNIVHQVILISICRHKMDYLKSMVRAINDGIHNK